MKRLFLFLSILGMIISCDKNNLKSKTEETLNKIDEVQKKVEKSIPDLDSLKNVSVDSLKISKISKRDVEKTLNKAKETVGEIKNKVDSVKNLKKDNSDGNKVEKTLKEIENLAKTEEKEEPKQSKNHKKKENSQEKIIYTHQPIQFSDEHFTHNEKNITKNVLIDLKVDDYKKTKSEIKELIYQYNGAIETENEEISDSLNVDYFTILVPLKNFDDVLDGITAKGTVVTRDIQTVGNKYDEATKCKINLKLQGKNEGKSVSGAFKSGWDGIITVLIFLVPFWPVFLLGGIGYYLYYRKQQKKKKEQSLSSSDPLLEAEKPEKENQSEKKEQ